MFNSIYYPLTLKPYNSVKHLEGKGNWAVSKYYNFPYRYFYRHKVKMIVDLLRKDSKYHNILDFGTGPGLYTPELKKYSLFIKSVDRLEHVSLRWRFDIVLCSSVLEFVSLPSTLSVLHSILKKDGRLIVASPMCNVLTDLYLRNDPQDRHHHETIIKRIKKKFVIEKINKWMGLYFALRARPK